MNVIGANLSSNTVLVEATPPANITFVNTINANVFEDGAIYARFGIENSDVFTKIKAYGGFTVQVSIEEVPAASDVDVAKQLEVLSTATAIVIRKFEHVFGE
ncbi:MAG: hypothetical protein M3O31_04745 [Acidobacteriota bacterium]|nr:hypothetical protein [Acidobacteriota bacterium]